MKNLYIIGNGLDIHHCINSSYSAYRKWLLENDKYLYERLCEYFDINEINKYEWWNDFENNLGNIKLHDYIMLKSFINQPNYERDDFMNMDLYTDTSDIEQDIGGLVEEIKNSFSEWIQSLYKARISNKIIISTKDNFFINFNYTHTLEDIYNIPSKDILHIHGDIYDKNYIIGHNKTFYDLLTDTEFKKPEPPDEYIPDRLQKWYNENFEEYKVRIYNEASIKEILKIRKDTDSIIKNNQSIFDKCKDVEHIYIYGLSFSSVDMPYLHEILSKIDIDKVRWTVSYYTKIDYDNINKFINDNSLNKTLFKIIRLEDIQIHKQLKLFDFE